MDNSTSYDFITVINIGHLRIFKMWP